LSLLPLLPIVLFCALLAAAVWHDVRARRIPNAIVFPGALMALGLHALLPSGAGLFSAPMGGLGILSGLGGLALGLAMLMPMYIMRLMGAGDVKLMAMVGAFVGAGQVLAVGLTTLLLGGLLALAFAACQRRLGRLVGNAYHMALHSAYSALAGDAVAPVAPPDAASGRLPYALAIAGAGLASALWLQAFGELPL
jgi:prepilin peptidase CpaA